MAIHFLGHLRDAAVDTARELRPALRDPARRGRSIRLFAVAASLVVGIGLAAAFTPSAPAWHLHRQDFHNGKFHG